MFGVVPRPLWSRKSPPDEMNRVLMSMRLLLIEDGVRTTLVDTGAGEGHDERFREIHALDARPVRDALLPAGLEPGQIDRVINTHLHFDHAGGNATPAGGQPSRRPALPEAEYLVQAAEVAVSGRRDSRRLRAAYSGVSLSALQREPGRLRTVEGEIDLGGGVRLLPAPGHTPGMQIVIIAAGEDTFAFPADLMPMAAHAALGWIPAYDLEPLVSMETKRRILRRAVEEEWKLVLQHDPEMPLAVLREESGGRLVSRPWEPRA